MRDFNLSNYEDQLTHQVIHMDQAVCYCPEFRASRMMHDYPSRKLQLVRSVYKGEIQANDYIAGLVFQSILSRQGERWQSFGENPEDFTDVMMLSREYMIAKGQAGDVIQALKEALNQNKGHFWDVDAAVAAWKDEVYMDASAETALFLDDITAVYCVDSAKSLAQYLKEIGIAIKEFSTEAIFMGFEYFAHGMIDEGIAHLRKVILDLEALVVKRVLVLSPMAYYTLTVLIPKVGLKTRLKFDYLPEFLSTVNAGLPAYVYGGSFNLRYLGNARLLNNLTQNTNERSVMNSQEFIPLVDGDVRLNTLTIWQKPLGAEFKIFGMDQAMQTAIACESLRDIKLTQPRCIITFEPTSLPILKSSSLNIPVYYYLDLLNHR